MAINKPIQNQNPIPGSDFSIMVAPKKQANVLIFADAGNGKSTFAVRFAPDPVAFINFDRRADYAVMDAMKRKRKVYVTGVDVPANVTKLGTQEAMKIGQAAVNKVIKNFELAVRESLKGNVRTICLDTGTEYNEILKLAVTGSSVAVKGDYGRSKDIINREWWRLYNLAREGNAHFIVLSRARELWENNQPTGKFTFRGPEVMNDAADWAAQLRVKTKKVKGVVEKNFEMEISKAGVNISQLGEVYTEDDWIVNDGPFAHACVMQYPGTTVEDWL